MEYTATRKLDGMTVAQVSGTDFERVKAEGLHYLMQYLDDHWDDRVELKIKAKKQLS